MTIEIDSDMQAELDARTAEDEKTRKPYILVTYENSGTWMNLGGLDKYADDPTELGRVVAELMHDAWDEWPDVDECDRLLVRVVTYTDLEIANLPEFPGW